MRSQVGSPEEPSRRQPEGERSEEGKTRPFLGFVSAVVLQHGLTMTIRLGPPLDSIEG
uniref:Uncharacterized protein n=1 Tax=Aegilops tauschii subsp. strangulata TaxID=200361 RepID=A0A453NM38_AEGTS